MSEVINEGAVDSTVEEQPSHLAMSDEDFLKMPVPQPKTAVAKDEEVVPQGVQTTTGADQAENLADDADDAAGGKPAKEAAVDADLVDAGEEGEKKPAAETTEPKEAKSKDAAAVDYEAEYKRLLTPFKANGRDIAVNSVDDAIALMQMGANYNKKMAALKPNLKLMKMLENNGLMSEDKIGFLIDLGKKDPAAINKLVKDSGLDPMDLDAEKAKTYKPTAYAVDDREIELDTVLDELQGSSTYTRTLDVVSNKWDVASKQTVSQNPQLLKVINDHVASGIYDQISTEVERERVFGRLKGMSDIEAYRTVGDAIQARGGFNHLAPSQGQSKPVAKTVIAPPPAKVEDDKLKDKRRAASSTKPAAPTSMPKDFNPLAMSDDEFSKLVKPKFL